MPAAGPPVFVVWHKWSDLRAGDHEPAALAYRRAARERGAVLHVHVLERELLSGRSRVAGVARCAPRRAVFWRECVADLARRLRAAGQDLLVIDDGGDGPGDALARLCDHAAVRAVFAHRELCDEELRAEDAARRALAARGAALEVVWGALTVHHVDDLGFDPADPRRMPAFKGEFWKLARGLPVRPPLPPPARLCPPPCDLADLGVGYAGDGGIDAAFAAAGAPMRWDPPPAGVGDAAVYGTWAGGETAALAHLDALVRRGGLAAYVGATESFTHGGGAVDAGTRLSPWLAFGCVSARAVVHAARAAGAGARRGRGRHGPAAQRLHKELVFRDFLRFSMLTWGTRVFRIGGPFGTSGLEWRRDAAVFDRWRAGRTGFPFVDAGMRELAATGWMSFLHRQCCAAFLVRDLRIDWRMGAEYFESTLLDHTPDANWGNWAYRILPRPCLVAAGCPVRAHISTLEVLAWPVVHDPHLKHTLAWLPELRGLPRDLAREPWRAGAAARRGAAVRIAPYRDSPLWFCSANRVNWGYEYAWLCGGAWTVARAGVPAGADYPPPMVPPLDLEVDLRRLPVGHGWGDTPQRDRPHVVGTGAPLHADCAAPPPPEVPGEAGGGGKVKMRLAPREGRPARGGGAAPRRRQ